MIIIGLTGSIAMGKSTAAAALERLGVPVHDADAEVHTLLKPGSEAYPALIAAFPYFSYPFIYTRSKRGGAGIIDRGALGRLAFSKDKEREKLESVLHPYVRAAQNRFVRAEEKAGRALVALDHRGERRGVAGRDEPPGHERRHVPGPASMRQAGSRRFSRREPPLLRLSERAARRAAAS